MKIFAEMGGELVLAGKVPVEIPLANGVDLAALTAGDDSPDRFVYMRVGKGGELSANGRRWSGAMLQKVVDKLPLYSYRGHPTAKAGESAPFQDFSTAWVGGKMHGGELLVKGYVPKDETVLKERIRVSLAAGKPMQVSPWGAITGRRQGGETVVEDFEPERIDWGAPGTAGFRSSAVLAAGGELNQTEETSMTEKEIQELQAKNLQLGGELKTAQDALAMATAKVTTLEGTVATVGGELKTLKEQAEAKVKAEVKAHRETLLGKLPGTERELGGELLTGETVADLDKNFEVVVGKLKKARPGLRIIGGETKEQEEDAKDKDFAKD